MVCDSDGTFACGSIVLLLFLLFLGAFTLVFILLMGHQQNEDQSGVIYRYKCDMLECDEEFIGETQKQWL